MIYINNGHDCELDIFLEKYWYWFSYFSDLKWISHEFLENKPVFIIFRKYKSTFETS
jgi:hypothetical protein